MSFIETFRKKLIARRTQISNITHTQSETISKLESSIDEYSIEFHILEYLIDLDINFPIDTKSIAKYLNKKRILVSFSEINKQLVDLNKLELICLKGFNNGEDLNTDENLSITTSHHDKIELYIKKLFRNSKVAYKNEKKNSKRRKISYDAKEENNVMELLLRPTALEKEKSQLHDDINELLSRPSAKEQILIEQFRSKQSRMQEFCTYGTKEECYKSLYYTSSNRYSHSIKKCSKIHFKKIIKPHTDITLGDCSFLNTCFHMDTCKYIHYEIDMNDVKPEMLNTQTESIVSQISTKLIAPQWVQCDLRTFDMSVLGKFSVVVADPPWDIHMELPYGTMADDEMRQLNIPSLQDEGYIFLWVTGRAMELGRECLKIWGYERCDELIWVKTNQLQRIIRTGRTGHWLNHGKEHCLVGVKGNPREGFNKGIDCDIIVSEVRATSHKPDEIYGIIERLAPGKRKIELFGRPHNVQPNWVTLGNELDGIRLFEPETVKRFKEQYPNGYFMNQSDKNAKFLAPIPNNTNKDY